MSISKEHRKFIDKKRGEILAELEEYLIEFRLPMAKEDVLLEVLNDTDDEDSFEDLILYLMGHVDGDPELAQEFAMELYNFFPRESLNGMSYAETVSFEELLKLDEEFEKFKNG
ncbi:MAG: hypothetical protein A2672_01100 [Candidatus Wildermuthbacteria bacterium RIFCSPHIGHO2_01_FULL_49_22b]|uniref:Uncharacterized protein n=1 Tax=Candidatus Wildermuthbacteria bacterium RIFCSPHIGHO2_01_FULL_49_22b TaxID=1802448 RepID=A0A1G2QZV6_9BACT|nr:MAG: hypothetical protein A2672_01100 [Candidatus Wildermuthbacteria bacterium RIFCSPHIGHO2_01_FULL_49_22b]